VSSLFARKYVADDDGSNWFGLSNGCDVRCLRRVFRQRFIVFELRKFAERSFYFITIERPVVVRKHLYGGSVGSRGGGGGGGVEERVPIFSGCTAYYYVLSLLSLGQSETVIHGGRINDGIAGH